MRRWNLALAFCLFRKLYLLNNNKKWFLTWRDACVSFIGMNFLQGKPFQKTHFTCVSSHIFHGIFSLQQICLHYYNKTNILNCVFNFCKFNGRVGLVLGRTSWKCDWEEVETLLKLVWKSLARVSEAFIQM